MTEADIKKVTELLKKAELKYDAREFKRVASARTLYHWNSEAHQEY